MASAPDLAARLADKGARLREVNRALLRKEPGTTQRWFQGPDGCDLFLWYDEAKGLAQLQLTFERRVVEWSLAGGLRTGHLDSFDPLTPDVDQARVVLDRAPAGETLALAAALLGSAPVDELTLALVRRHLGIARR